MKTYRLSTGHQINLYTPKELKEYLDKYVIGQEEAKKILSTAIYNHYKKILLSETPIEGVPEKSNIIVCGPTGSGKTFIVKTIANLMGVPYYIRDASGLTEAGYVGADCESLLTGLFQAADCNLELAQIGIVFIDEVDKLARQKNKEHYTSNAGAEGVQHRLLKIIEGDEVAINPSAGRLNPETPKILFNTERVLFVGMGAFAGIEDIIKKRLVVNNKIGYAQIEERKEEIPGELIFDYITQDDFRKYGYIPEFIGRFAIIANVKALTEENLVSIMKDTKESILEEYQILFNFDGISLTFETEALFEIAKTSIKLKTGARSLRTLLEDVLSESMFTMPGGEVKELVVTKEMVASKLDARYRNIKNEQHAA